MDGRDDNRESNEMDFDWGNSFDDLDAEFWDDHYGGPETDSALPDNEDEYLITWSDKSRGFKLSDSNNPLSHLAVGSDNQYTMKCKVCSHEQPVTNFTLISFSKRINLSKYKDIQSLLSMNQSRFRCSKCGHKNIKIFKRVFGKLMPS